ncbi:MAG: Rieske (2Fe-2S) domain protein [Acidimicrobiales bacterium]|jgi:ubiquinol-cytochrome c reductase iron-sulfur subunit|nr:Rieske (2Fe-2S) domain protein [Acidimicrobiales bacterium]
MSRAEKKATLAFAIATVAALGLAVVYWTGGQPQIEGALLGVGFAGIGYGMVTWANHILADGHHVQEREPLSSLASDRAAFETDVERGGEIGRRTVLLKAMGAAVGAMGVAALFPIRSLGPRPGRSLSTTPWHDGLRLVTETGQPVRAADVPLDGLVTVFPEGLPGSADGQAVLVRVRPELIRAAPGRADWSPDGYLVYSKICTHAGCPVGLYEAQDHQLLCPCHQSTFDVLRGARPVFGPAAAALPQLPVRIDADGFLVARGDFPVPVGPSYWHRS